MRSLRESWELHTGYLFLNDLLALASVSFLQEKKKCVRAGMAVLGLMGVPMPSVPERASGRQASVTILALIISQGGSVLCRC